MNSNGSIEQRLAMLEREVAALKRRIAASSPDWLEQVSGSMADIPQDEFDQFVRYSEEFRRAQSDAAE